MLPGMKRIRRGRAWIGRHSRYSRGRRRRPGLYYHRYHRHFFMTEQSPCRPDPLPCRYRRRRREIRAETSFSLRNNYTTRNKKKGYLRYSLGPLGCPKGLTQCPERSSRLPNQRPEGSEKDKNQYRRAIKKPPIPPSWMFKRTRLHRPKSKIPSLVTVISNRDLNIIEHKTSLSEALTVSKGGSALEDVTIL